MDEYIGLPADAPQRFGTFLSRAIFDRKPFRKVHLMNSGAGDGRQECLRYSELLRRAPLDIVSLGIGENGHIAFNDPHEARFDDPETVKSPRSTNRAASSRSTTANSPTYRSFRTRR